MTDARTATADDWRAVAERLHRLQHIREDLAARLWAEWLSTTEGRRYEGATGADRRARAIRGWRWVAGQVRVMASCIEDADDTTATPTGADRS